MEILEQSSTQQWRGWATPTWKVHEKKMNDTIETTRFKRYNNIVMLLDGEIMEIFVGYVKFKYIYGYGI